VRRTSRSYQEFPVRPLPRNGWMRMPYAHPVGHASDTRVQNQATVPSPTHAPALSSALWVLAGHPALATAIHQRVSTLGEYCSGPNRATGWFTRCSGDSDFQRALRLADSASANKARRTARRMNSAEDVPVNWRFCLSASTRSSGKRTMQVFMRYFLLPEQAPVTGVYRFDICPKSFAARLKSLGIFGFSFAGVCLLTPHARQGALKPKPTPLTHVFDNTRLRGLCPQTGGLIIALLKTGDLAIVPGS